MRMHKFIKSVQSSLGSKDYKKEGKKEQEKETV